MTTIYDTCRQALLHGTLAWDASDLRAVLVSPGYKFSRGHRVLRDVLPHALGASDPLRGCEIEGLTATAQSCYIIATKEARGAGVVVYRHSDGILLAYAPITPVQAVIGQRVDVSWPNGVVLSLEDE